MKAAGLCLGIVALFALVGAAKMMPDFVRYLKIRAM
jgi:hypothetical protein